MNEVININQELSEQMAGLVKTYNTIQETLEGFSPYSCLQFRNYTVMETDLATVYPKTLTVIRANVSREAAEGGTVTLFDMQIVLTGSDEDQSRLERLNFLLKRIFLKPKEESRPRYQYYTFGFQFLFDGEVMEGFEKNEYIAPEVVADWFNYVMKSTTFPGVTEVRAVYHGDLRNPVKIDLIPEIWFKSQGGKK